jgi:hypothetical protein
MSDLVKAPGQAGMSEKIEKSARDLLIDFRFASVVREACASHLTRLRSRLEALSRRKGELEEQIGQGGWTDMGQQELEAVKGDIDAIERRTIPAAFSNLKWAEGKLMSVFLVQLIQQRKALGDPLSSAFADLMKELVSRGRELREAHEKLPAGRA